MQSDFLCYNAYLNVHSLLYPFKDYYFYKNGYICSDYGNTFIKHKKPFKILFKDDIEELIKEINARNI